MGQTFSSIIGFVIVFYLKMSERVKNYFNQGNKKERQYYNNDILLKDDEQCADILSREEIDKIIKGSRNSNKGVAEYKIIKNSIEMDETECLTIKNDTPLQKEIQEIHKELNIHDDTENMEDENIEDLKSSILNADEI